MQNMAHARQCRTNPQQTEHEILSALSACVRLSQAGCRILCAHVHDGLPGVIVDRRPDIPGLTPGSLYADWSGAYYQARLGTVGVSWTEPRRARA